MGGISRPNVDYGTGQAYAYCELQIQFDKIVVKV